MSNENKAKSSAGSKIGAFAGWVFTAAACGTVGWFLCEMWPRPEQKKVAPPARVSTVAVTGVKEMPYNLPEKFVAHAEAMQEVDLLPQVDGYIKSINFKEGATVKAGEVLYEIDPERYQAVVNQRKADLRAAEAEANRAERYAKRMQKADVRGITQLELDNSISDAEKAKAAVEQAKANLVVAEYDLNRTKVLAPISGQIGKSNAYLGDYVAPSKGALARIVQIDPIRVSFPLTDRAYIAWRAAQMKGKEIDYRMRLVLPDGSFYNKEGTWEFDDNKMSAETATIMMRLSFPNPDRMLIPNSYVTLITDFKTPPKYLMVPQVALFDLPGGNLGVWVMKKDQTVEARPVKTLEMHDGFVPVLDGVKLGEKVVTSGVGKLAPGMKVVLVQPTDEKNSTPDPKHILK